MKLMHVIFFQDEAVVCKNKKCKNKVFITPVDPDGMWRCPKCEKQQRIVEDLNVSFKIEED